MRRYQKKDSYYYTLIQSTQWRVLRNQKMKDCNGLCERCLKQGVVTPATEVHHITPVERDKNRAMMAARCFDYNNLMCVCRDCHDALHGEMQSHTMAARVAGVRQEAKDMAEMLLGEELNRDKLTE